MGKIFKLSNIVLIVLFFAIIYLSYLNFFKKGEGESVSFLKQDDGVSDLVNQNNNYKSGEKNITLTLPTP